LNIFCHGNPNLQGGFGEKIRAMLGSFFWLTLPLRSLTQKDPAVWLDGARPPSKYVSKNPPLVIQQLSDIAITFGGLGDLLSPITQKLKTSMLIIERWKIGEFKSGTWYSDDLFQQTSARHADNLHDAKN
jgi:hypothetical protein